MTASTRSFAISMARALRMPPFDPATAALGLAGLTVVAGLSVGLVFGVASALLAFVTGALLGAILLVWHSLRTLAGDADVDPALEVATTHRTDLSERKQRALRALKDIEQEHAVGKIDAADFAMLDAEYRSRAKDVIREMDASLDAYRAKAEAMVSAHLAKHAQPKASPAAAERPTCSSCEATNDADATFCKKCGAKL
jgi:hypothetical protein